MKQYIVTVRYRHESILKCIEKFRVNADDEEQAERKARKHTLFPSDGTIERIREACYYKPLKYSK